MIDAFEIFALNWADGITRDSFYTYKANDVKEKYSYATLI